MSDDDVRAIAKEAYIYGFPMVDNYRIQYSYFVDGAGPEYKGPWNVVHNTARVYTPDDKAIQTPNSDTPYSFVGADLRTEPLVLSVPPIEPDRYYSLQFVDGYTYNFAYLGTRATGNRGGTYLLAGPGWSGDSPAGVDGVIRADTEFAFVLYRTQLFGASDIEKVKDIQAGYRVQPLSEFLGQPRPTAAPVIEFPVPLPADQQKSSPAFFDLLDFALGLAPVLPEEADMRARLASVGLGTGTFDSADLDAATRQAFQDGIADAWAEFEDFRKHEVITERVGSAQFFGTRGQLDGNYLYRMAGAVLGIYGNTAAEAIYPGALVDDGGAPLTGGARYTYRFAPGQLPPVDAFWSLTMYELPASLLVANPIDRYLINSAMLPELITDADGGYTLYLQHESPDPQRQPNWLPAPAGPFLVALRLYLPQQSALEGRWAAPKPVRV